MVVTRHRSGGPAVASVWVRTRTTKDGENRHLVEYRVGGRDSKVRHGGSFKTKRLATLPRGRDRARARRPTNSRPRARGETERPKLPTLLEASVAWQASR